MKRRAAGQAFVESALTLAGFFVIIFGVIDFGRAFWTWQALSAAAREGARWAIVHGADAGMTKTQTEIAVEDYVLGHYGAGIPKEAKVKISWPNGTNVPGNPVRVALEYTFRPVTPLVGNKTMKLNGVAEMQIIR
jgi:Flp pilus assembly protein TadG